MELSKGLAVNAICLRYLNISNTIGIAMDQWGKNGASKDTLRHVKRIFTYCTRAHITLNDVPDARSSGEMRKVRN